MLAIRILLAVSALASLLYTFRKRDRRPIERLSNTVCASAALYFALLVVWR